MMHLILSVKNLKIVKGNRPPLLHDVLMFLTSVTIKNIQLAQDIKSIKKQNATQQYTRYWMISENLVELFLS